MGLFNELSEVLKISEDNPGFINPVSGEEILTFPDWIHLIKLFRNNVLDHGFKLKDGTAIKKEHFEKLIAVNRSELTAVFKLKDKHVNVTGRERQRVYLAYQIFSETVGKAFEKYFPENKGLSSFVLLMNDVSDILNSRCPDGNNNWKKSGYGKHLKEQESKLNEFADVVREMRHFTPKGVSRTLLPCQKNTLINIESTKRLFENMKAKFGIEYLLTARLNQDYIENLFSSVRGLGVFHQNPSPVDCITRLKTLIITRSLQIPQSCSAHTEKCWDGEMQAEILKYLTQNQTLQTLEDSYEKEAREAATVLENIMEKEDTTEISSNNWEEFNESLSLQELCEFGGEDYLAGYIASKIKESWMRLANENLTRFPESWTQTVSRGNLVTPSYVWLNLFRMLNSKFNSFHKSDEKYQFNRTEGVVRLLQEKLILEHPDIPEKILKMFVRVRTFIRVKYLNKFREQKNQAEYRKRLLRSNS